MGSTQSSLMRLLLAGAALAPVAAAPEPAGAQGVTGAVLDSATAAPLPGVLVEALDADGTRVGATLSDAAGRFTIRLNAPGRYRARAERIGLRTATTEWIEVAGSELRATRIAMSGRAVRIEGFVVDSRVRECRLDGGQAVRIQSLWDEIRKALEISLVVQRERLIAFRIESIRREWSADLGSISADTTVVGVGRSEHPYVSAGAELLLGGGFVQGEPGQRRFYGPDANVLLSDEFLFAHCFSLADTDDGAGVVDTDDRAGVVGLTFEPLPSREVPDIAGTLWVDTATAELEHLEYRYVGLQWLPPHEGGGRVTFSHLPSGAWIVSDWYIRMPRVGLVRGPESPIEVSVIAGYVDVGGRVHPLTTPEGLPRGDRARTPGSPR